MKTITYSKWMAIPLSIRQQIAHAFGISKVRSISVINNVVVDDGFDIHAVEGALSVEAMQKYLDSKESDANVLLSEVVSKLSNVIEKPIDVRPEIPAPIEKPKKVDKTEGLVSKVIKSPAKKKK